MSYPIKVSVKKGENYFWCSCGKSLNQPFCDGSHKTTLFQPLEYFSSKTEDIFFCVCKKTKSPPFCDGSHEQKLFKLLIEPDNKEIEISQDESILTASLRNNITHSSACGGNGKCSTCRVQIISGIKNCSNPNEIEKKISKKLSFPDDIRLACQTSILGDVRLKRLILDKRDLKSNNQTLSNKITSVGNIKNLTVMFCDIKGFTNFSESLSAYDVIFILNKYFSIMREIIIKNGGEINNYIGDAILAVFGMEENSQQVLRSVNAAILMIEAMDEFKKYLFMSYKQDFDLRIGIHYGEVIVGSVGEEKDKKITVIGDTVNIASRIEQINKDADTRLLVSEAAYEQIKTSVEINNYLRLKLRGSSKLFSLYEVNKIKKGSLKKYNFISKRIIKGKNWIKTIPISEINQKEKVKFKINESKELLIIRDGSFFVIENNCPHMNLPLDVGQLTALNSILCPYHNSEFCYKTGEVRKWIGSTTSSINKQKNLKTYKSLIHEDYLWVDGDI
ncbi:MAG: Adenylate cyclase 1 [Alphaproteobacteria bacterium MarineAlpha2_Bin1]|nr:MAG: Adenylate cyclase 1 [Alphaproteobacteria bacterium MarineAlpha2_Bin1]